jgi:nitroimidazol reductase NimA-like FMN-containing flavoprotein (pyridoxamine 5'-phosphate oxidase superfamily)
VADATQDHSIYHDFRMNTYAQTSRTRVRRLPKRGVYDKAVVHSILDEGLLCHLGFAVEGQPYVIPTLYARDGERVYFHGSAVSRMLKTVAEGIDVCLTVTLVDAYVLARSAFHHSMNYRSVVVLGRAQLLTDDAERMHALHVLTNHIVPNRWEEVREPNELEVRQTAVLALPLEEVSAKIRTGEPKDDEEDYALPVWAGIVPITPQVSVPVGDSRVRPDASAPDLNRFVRAPKTS